MSAMQSNGFLKTCRIRKPGLCIGLQMTVASLAIAAISYFLISLTLVG